jgi:hypothetical protein
MGHMDYEELPAILHINLDCIADILEVIWGLMKQLLTWGSRLKLQQVTEDLCCCQPAIHYLMLYGEQGKIMLGALVRSGDRHAFVLMFVTF